jgi:hypothetical protein
MFGSWRIGRQISYVSSETIVSADSGICGRDGAMEAAGYQVTKRPKERGEPDVGQRRIE